MSTAVRFIHPSAHLFYVDGGPFYSFGWAVLINYSESSMFHNISRISFREIPIEFRKIKMAVLTFLHWASKTILCKHQSDLVLYLFSNINTH